MLMITGYTRPLYLLPFDHRTSYISGLFGWKEPLTVEQRVTVANSKHVIYAGFQQAIAEQVPKDHAGLLVDEEFGAAILRAASRKGYVTVASVEQSVGGATTDDDHLILYRAPTFLLSGEVCFVFAAKICPARVAQGISRAAYRSLARGLALSLRISTM